MRNVITNTGNYFSGEFESSETSGANKGETAAPNRFFSKTKQAAFVFGSVLLLFLLLSLTSLEAKATTFIVNTKEDDVDVNVGDGVCDVFGGSEQICSLRAAIQEANHSPGVDDIAFSPDLNGAINLRYDRGKLLITSSMNINGPGARALTVSAGTGFHNVFDIRQTQGSFIVNISGITISNGRAYRDGNANSGGGIMVGGGSTVTLTEVAVKDNVAVNGGGIAILGGTLNLVRSTVSDNFAGRGGGIYNASGGTTNIVNSTISDNRATNDNLLEPLNGGGGILNAARITLVNSTVSNNTSLSQGGGIMEVYEASYLINTIVAANKAEYGGDLYGYANSLGNNLINDAYGNNGFWNNVNGDIIGNPGAPIDARLGPLQNNGGQTDTRALLAGSPALNAGNSCVTQACWVTPLNTDQRGMLRKYGKSVDIGAFESKTLGTTDPVSVGGKILLPNNRGLRNAPTVMTDASGKARYAVSDALGQYRFDGVAAGETYIFEVRNMRNGFPPQVVLL